MTRILVVGGYGVFGSRIAERLLRHAGLTVIVAGRNLDAARACADRLGNAAGSAGGTRIEAAALDAARMEARDIGGLAASVVIHTAGPFQGQDYRVARAAIAAGAHYIDLADGREFVCGIGALDAEARAAGVLVTSGASTVPAIAAAVLDRIAARMARLESVTCAISPGNSFDPGPATAAAILGGAGRAFQALRGGRMETVHGWQPLTWRSAPGAGTRLLGCCDVPDLVLFPRRYPTLGSQHFLAGVEVKAFHLGIWALAWLVRSGLLRSAAPLARPLLGLKRRLGFLGSDRGLMLVEASGRDAVGNSRRAAWRLLAERGHGPYVPGTPAVVLAAKLAAGTLGQRGAVPCVGLLDLEDIAAEIGDLAIAHTLREC